MTHIATITAPDFASYTADFEADLPKYIPHNGIEHLSDTAAFEAIDAYAFDNDLPRAPLMAAHHAQLTAELVDRGINEMDRRFVDFCKNSAALYR